MPNMTRRFACDSESEARAAVEQHVATCEAKGGLKRIVRDDRGIVGWLHDATCNVWFVARVVLHERAR